MKPNKNLLFITLVLFLISLQFGFSNSSDKPLTSRTFIEVSKKVLPSVVSIRVKKTFGMEIQLKKKDEKEKGEQEEDKGQLPEGDLDELLKRFFQPFPFFKPDFPEEFEYSAAGSGLITRSDGYIITNNHMVSQVKEGNIEVKLNNGKVFTGEDVKVVGVDTLSDIAVIKINGKDLPSAEWGDSDKVEIGEWVIALGNPLELNNSVTQGIVSAKGREIKHAPLEDLIQTTAIINPGNSGGPLVNLDGQVVGINVAIASNTGYWQGVGFTIPSNVVKNVSNSLIDEGKVKRGYIGILMDNLRADTAKFFEREPNTGIIVTNVNAGCPAEKAGIRPGDVIIEVEGQKIKDTQSMVKAIATKDVGKEVKIKVLRYEKGKVSELNFTVNLAERPSEDEITKLQKKEKEAIEAPKQEYSSLGLKLEDITDPMGKKGPGVVVKSIKAGSLAAESSLRSGDIIFEVNNIPVNSASDFDKALEKKPEGKGHFILFERNTIRSFTVINPEKKK